MPDFTVKVFDNVFDEQTHKKIWESMCRPKWNLTGGNKEGGGRFWHMEGLEKEDFYSNFLFTIICEKLLKEKVSAFKINRIYANGQTANQNGTAHIDNHLPNTFTFLYYPNLEWHWWWNGALFFLNAAGGSPDSQTDIVKTVSFKPNRAVYFSANMCHYAEAPSNIFKDLRVSIAWKFSKYL